MRRLKKNNQNVRMQDERGGEKGTRGIRTGTGGRVLVVEDVQAREAKGQESEKGGSRRMEETAIGTTAGGGGG